jgi:hypothetical protein
MPISNRYVTKSIIFPRPPPPPAFQQEDVTAANRRKRSPRPDPTMTAERLINVRDQQSPSGLVLRRARYARPTPRPGATETVPNYGTRRRMRMRIPQLSPSRSSVYRPRCAGTVPGARKSSQGPRAARQLPRRAPRGSDVSTRQPAPPTISQVASREPVGVSPRARPWPPRPQLARQGPAAARVHCHAWQSPAEHGAVSNRLR